MAGVARGGVHGAKSPKVKKRTFRNIWGVNVTDAQSTVGRILGGTSRKSSDSWWRKWRWRRNTLRPAHA